ncbi:MAG: hypothetical protein ACXW5U_01520 [Thermoanaerobaculia bacterium]
MRRIRALLFAAIVLAMPLAAQEEVPRQEVPEHEVPEQAATAQEEVAAPRVQNHATVAAEAQTDSRADSLFNPGGSLYSPPLHSQIVRLNDDLSAELPKEISLRAKFSVEWSHAGGDRVTRGQVRELFLSRSLGDFNVYAGRRILKWTNGYAFSPAGLLDPPRNPSDPQDRLGRLGGRDLVQADWIRGDHTATVVYSFPFETRAGGGERVLAARYNVLLRGFDLSLLAAIPSESPARAAFTFNYVIGQALEVHGEASVQRGSDVVHPSAAFDDDPRLYGLDYFTDRDDDDVRLRTLAGASFTFRDGTNLIAEYYHTDEGLTAGEWGNFIEQGRYADSLRADPRFTPVRDGMTLPELNLVQGLSFLRGQEIQRDYAFLRLSRSFFGKVSVSALTLINIHDRSSLVAPEVSFTLRRRTTFYARGVLFFGNEKSQYGNVPDRSVITAGIRQHF